MNQEPTLFIAPAKPEASFVGCPDLSFIHVKYTLNKMKSPSYNILY